MKIAAIICIVLAALTTCGAIANTVFDAAGRRPADATLMPAYVVGSFTIPMILLIAGLSFWGRANRK